MTLADGSKCHFDCSYIWLRHYAYLWVFFEMCYRRIQKDLSGLSMRGCDSKSMTPGQEAALQVNGVPRSFHNKFATFFEALDRFTAYCTFKSEPVTREPQADTITDEEVDRLADEFTKLWLAPLPTDFEMPGTLLRPREYCLLQL